MTILEARSHGKLPDLRGNEGPALRSTERDPSCGRAVLKEREQGMRARNPHGASVVVTGVAGFVGSHLAARLLDLGFDVVGIDNLFSGKPENILPLRDHPGFTFYLRSVTEVGLLSDLLASHPDLSCCFHLAAIVSVPYSLDHPEETMATNYKATVDLLREAEAHGFRSFVFAGSAAEYGDDSRLPLLETYTDENTVQLSHYGRAKFLASQEVGRSSIGVVLRCFNIYGPRQDPASPYSGVISRFIRMALKGDPITIFGDGNQTRDFIEVSDVVEGYVRAAGLEASCPTLLPGVYNVGRGIGTSILDLAVLVQELTKSPSVLQFLEERAGDIRHSRADISSFKRVFRWRPQVDLIHGLTRTIEWMRSGT